MLLVKKTEKKKTSTKWQRGARTCFLCLKQPGKQQKKYDLGIKFGSLEKANFRASKAKYRHFLRFNPKFVALTPGPYEGALL
jgi:hypothetical protein